MKFCLISFRLWPKAFASKYHSYLLLVQIFSLNSKYYTRLKCLPWADNIANFKKIVKNSKLQEKSFITWVSSFSYFLLSSQVIDSPLGQYYKKFYGRK
jgi:hypothetical protein